MRVAKLPIRLRPATYKLASRGRNGWRVTRATYCELVIIEVALEACSGGSPRACSIAMCIMVPAEMIARSGAGDGRECQRHDQSDAEPFHEVPHLEVFGLRFKHLRAERVPKPQRFQRREGVKPRRRRSKEPKPARRRPLFEPLARTQNKPFVLNPVNRRIRTRMYGGVGGRSREAPPIPIGALAFRLGLAGINPRPRRADGVPPTELWPLSQRYTRDYFSWCKAALHFGPDSTFWNKSHEESFLVVIIFCPAGG